jgi:hypothetical protein
LNKPPAFAPTQWFSPGRFALILGALIFASFPQVLLGLQTFVVRDFGFFAYPLAHYQRECFWRGELPLWNPYNNCGAPFLAQWNTMPLYPPALVYLVLPLSGSLSFFCLLHLFWAGMGAYCLIRRWTDNLSAAAIAGVIFAFNGLSLNLLMWPSHIATLSWAPWVLLAVERAWQEGGRRIVVAAMAGAFQMLAGGPETILLTWLLAFALALVEWVRTSRHLSFVSRNTLVLRFAVVVLLVGGLAAAQLLPFLDLVAHSQREQGYADTRWSMPPWGWANFLVPMVFGSLWNKGVFFQYEQAWTSSYYLGIGALLLILLALWSVRSRRVWVLGIAAAVALLLSFGDRSFVYRWAHSVFPQLSMMTYPIKFVLVITITAPLLAGLAYAGLQHLPGEGKPRQQRRVIALGAVLLGLVAAILFWAWRFPFAGDDVTATLQNGLVRAALLVATLVLLVAVARVSKPAIQQVLALVLIAMFWFDVRTHEPPQNPTAPAWIYDVNLARNKLAMEPQPALGESRAMVSPAADLRFGQIITSDPKDNFLAKRMGYFADCNLLDAVPKVNGFFSLYPHEAGELSSLLYGSTNTYLDCLADFMSVSQITAPGKFVDWTPRATFMPLVTAGQRPIYLDDTNTLLTLVRPDFNPRTTVILPLEARTAVSVTNQTLARVIPRRFSAKVVEVDVEAQEPSLVVVSQTYYHPWRAYVDGQRTQVLRANYAFQALEAPAGHHHLTLAYEDRALYVGAAVSGLTLAACVGSWKVRRIRRTR